MAAGEGLRVTGPGHPPGVDHPLAPPQPPDWPTQEPTAAELIRYAVGRGIWLSGRGWGFVEGGVFERHDDLLMMRYLATVTQMQAMYDLTLLLKKLTELDRAAADEMASEVWHAADAGDSYGEWLWQWAKEAGLDPDALNDAGRRAAEQYTRSPDDGDPFSSDERARVDGDS